MGNRSIAALALALAFGALTAPVVAATRPITGVGSVDVVAATYVPSGEASPSFSAAALTYILVTAELTNTSTHPFTPSIARFFLTDHLNERFAATDTGSSVFVGVSNSRKPLQPGEKRKYTIGFRVNDPAVTGAVSYEP